MNQLGLFNSAGPIQPPVSGTLGGLIPVENNAAMDARASREQAEKENNKPVIQSLAAHVRKHWTLNYMAKQQTVEERMLQAMRQRRGEYDPDVMQEISKTGGSAIYMMLTSNKCRAAGSWLRDVLNGQGGEKPWGITPTPLPDLAPAEMQNIAQQAVEEAQALEQALGAPVTTPASMKVLMDNVKDRKTVEAQDSAKAYAARMEMKMEDQLNQGMFGDSLSEFVDDLTTFPSAILKGPVIRNKPKMKWVQGADQQWVPEVKDELVLEWERVDPFMAYPAPHSSGINDGDFIERHRLARSDLVALKGVEGYSKVAIEAVLEQYGNGGLHEWLRVDTQKAQVEGKSTISITQNDLIDALQYWGSVQGKMLVEWGMDKKDVPDLTKEYYCEIWLIGSWVIKATLNYDPFGRKPYYKTSYEEIPGVFWGNSVADLVRDCQTVCNAAARALVNNMGIASGPQAAVNVDRLPAGEDVTQMYPWKIWQTVNDPYGSSAAPISFFQPNSLAQELMMIHNQFSELADEYSGVPRYMSGNAQGSGALRTSSGMSMLMNNAGKAMKQVVNNVDQYVLRPLIERLYYYNMKYSDDPELKGDVNIIARGANGVMAKESAQQRRNEFLQIVLNNQTVQSIVGTHGIAALLRETAKTLDMDIDKLVPSDEALRALEIKAQQAQAMQQAAAQGQQPNAPKTMSNPNQNLASGAPITDHFSPMKQG